MPVDRPIVFLAFADAKSDLSSLRIEGWSLKDQFDLLKQRGVIADVVVEEKASLERIYSVFLKHRDRIALFHFGGHADGDRVLLQSAFEARPAYADGLATLLGLQRGLKLVFLNGCSTRPQVKRLLNAGVPAVIATALPIVDQVATDFAVAFYQALTTGYSYKNWKITGACSLAAAFAQAEGLIKAGRGGNHRDFVFETPTALDVIDDGGCPWNVQYRPGSEQVARWNLFEDDPLFGLPDLPDDIGWPAEPYRNLEYFQREHARIFFGRGRAIRELYDLVGPPAESAESRLIFYYGQTGVGKTSVLAAGLLPRLEAEFATRYCRRSAQHGLLGTLADKLAPGMNPFDLRTAWLDIEHQAKRPLLIVLDQAEEAFTRPRLESRPRDEVRAVFDAVRDAFASNHSERPQGRLILGFRKEWLAEFAEIRKASKLDIKPVMLDPLDRPGVIEAIEGPADHFGLVIKPDRTSVKPGEPGLAEFVSHDLFDTLANPQTEQESPIAPTLQILLTRMWEEANDPKRLRGRPTFDRVLYQDLKSKGFRLNEVIQEQFDRIAEVVGLREAVEKGLLLDLLEFFTTHEATAETRTREQIRQRYPDLPAERLDALLEACQARYLLAHVGVGADGTRSYRLTHDTLAPLLRERFRVSPDIAQRARNILTGRAATWKGQPTDPTLDRVDLASVEAALPWMRALQTDETALLEASRQAEKRRVDEEEARRRQLRESQEGEEQERRAKEHETKLRLSEQQDANRRLRQRAYGLLAALAATAVFAALSAWQRHEANVETGIAQAQTKIAQELTKKARESAEVAKAQTAIAREQTSIAESRRLAALSDAVRPERLDLALLLALEAAKQADTVEARECLHGSLDERPEVGRFLHVPEGDVTSVAFGPGGEIAAGYPDGIVLFDARGERGPLAPLKVKPGPVVSVAFGPEGRIAAGCGASGAALFDARGEPLRLAPIDVKAAYVTSVAYGPEGQIAAAYGIFDGKDHGGVVLFNALRERVSPAPLEVKEGGVWSVACGPKGQIAAGYAGLDGGGVVVFDARGERLPHAPLKVKEGSVTSVAFGPEGQIAAGYDGKRDGVVLFDARGERVPRAPLEVPQGNVRGVAFGPQGKVAAGYESGRDGNGGVALFDAGGTQLRPPLEVKEGTVWSVAFGSTDQIAAGYHGLAGRGGGGGVVLFEPRRDRLRAATLAVKVRGVSSVAFGPEDQIAAGYSQQVGGQLVGGVMLSDAQRNPPRPALLEVKEGGVMSVAFGPQGQFAAGYEAAGGAAGVVLFDARGERLRPAALEVKEGNVFSVAFNAEGQIAAGYARPDRGGVVLFDGRGDRLQPAALEVKEGGVSSVSFGPDGQIAAGYDAGPSGGGVVLFGARRERLRPAPLEVKEGRVTSVSFGPEARIAAGYAAGDGGGVVLFDARGERLPPAPLEVKEGTVESVGFGPAGQLAAGYAGGVVLFNAQGQRLRLAPLKVEEGTGSVAFGAKGTLAAAYSGSNDSGVVLFDADPLSWRRKAAQTANRNFTLAEWTQYFPGTPYRRTVRSLPWPHDPSEAELKQAEAFEKEHPEESDAP